MRKRPFERLLEKSSDADPLHERLGFAAERLMELEVGNKTNAVWGAKSQDRLVQRNGDHDRVWETRAGPVELRYPDACARARTSAGFLEPRRRTNKALSAVIQKA